MVDANRHASTQMAHLNALASLDIRCPLIRKRAKVSTFTAANFSNDAAKIPKYV